MALLAGPDGLDAYRAIARPAASVLRPGGLLALEIGSGQATAVTAILASAGLASIATHADLAGHPRCLTAQVPPAPESGDT